MSEITQKPWSATSDGYIAAPTDQMNEGFYIAQVFGPDADANLPAIIAAVNAHDIMTAALHEIADRHVPDQPASSPLDEADYIRSHHTELRRIAVKALAAAKEHAA